MIGNSNEAGITSFRRDLRPGRSAELVSVSTDAIECTDLTREAAERSLAALLSAAESSRSREDFSAICACVKRVLSRHRLRNSWALLVASSSELRGRMAVIAAEAADTAVKRIQDLPSRKELRFSVADAVVAFQWPALAVLLVVGKLIAEGNSRVAVTLALDKEIIGAFASLSLELMALHAILWQKKSSSRHAETDDALQQQQPMSDINSHEFSGSGNMFLPPEALHGAEIADIPRQSTIEDLPTFAHQSSNLDFYPRSKPQNDSPSNGPQSRNTAVDETPDILAYAVDEYRRSSNILPILFDKTEHQAPLPTVNGELSNFTNEPLTVTTPVAVPIVSSATAGETTAVPTSLQQKSPVLLPSATVRSVKSPKSSPRRPALRSLLEGTVSRTSSSSSTSSPLRAPPSAMATLGQTVLPSEYSAIDARVDESFSLTAARQEAMALLPKVFDWFLYGSIGIQLSELPAVSEKLERIIAYFATAQECAAYRLTSGTLLLHLIFRTPTLLSCVCKSQQFSMALLSFAAKLLETRGSVAEPEKPAAAAHSSTSVAQNPTKQTSGLWSSDSALEFGPTSLETISAVAAAPKQSRGMRWLRMLRCVPPRAYKPIETPCVSDHRYSALTAGLFDDITGDLLLVLSGSCLQHSGHNTTDTASVHANWTRHALPNDSGIASCTPAALQQRLPRGDAMTCAHPAFAALRICEPEVRSLARYAAEAGAASSADWNAIANLELPGLLIALETKAKKESKGWQCQITSSPLVAYRYKTGACCAYCGRVVKPAASQNKQARTLQCDRCCLALYCSTHCCKNDTQLHRSLCRAFN